jgi:nitrogen PTS system EIIA component
MSIDELISPADVLVDLRASDKVSVLRALAAHLAPRLNLDAEVAGALLKREELGSTGMGQGVAIPHARFEELKYPAAAFARLKRPIDFAAVDAEPVDLVWLLLLPPTTCGAHLDALALAARALRNPEVRAAARSARDADAIVQALGVNTSGR